MISMERVSTGINGLDEMLGGGVPRNHCVAVIGSFGTGKTTMGLHFMNEGMRNGERGIFITLEEDEDAIVADAESYGMGLREYVDSGKLVILKLEPTDARNTIRRVQSELPRFIEEFGAQRIVIDSISLLNMLYDNDAEKRTNLFNLSQLIKQTGATCMMTAEVRDDNPHASRDGLIVYTMDGVVSLRYDEDRERGEVGLSLRIVKMRRVKHDRRIKPYSITDAGIKVHAGADIY